MDIMKLNAPEGSSGSSNVSRHKKTKHTMTCHLAFLVQLKFTKTRLSTSDVLLRSNLRDFIWDGNQPSNKVPCRSVLPQQPYDSSIIALIIPKKTYKFVDFLTLSRHPLKNLCLPCLTKRSRNSACSSPTWAPAPVDPSVPDVPPPGKTGRIFRADLPERRSARAER